jgi:hypothetical protein
MGVASGKVPEGVLSCRDSTVGGRFLEQRRWRRCARVE